MRIAILSIAFLFLAFSAQSQVLKSAGVWYFLDVDSMTARPAVLPNGTELAYVVGTKTVYYWNRNTSTWTAYGSTFNRDSIYFDASIIGSGTVSDPWGVDSTLFATIAGVGDSIAAALGYVAANFFPLQGGTLTGTGGNGFVGFPLQSSPPSTPATGFSLFAGSTGNNISWMQPDGFFRRLVSPVTGTPRQYQFMARSYTLADSADVAALPTGSGTTNYYTKWTSSTALGIGNMTDNNTVVSILNSKPFSLGQWTTAGQPAGTAGYMGFRLSGINGVEWYNGTRWGYALESTFARGTATRIPFFDANGQVTDNAIFTLNTSTSNLNLTGRTIMNYRNSNIIIGTSTSLANPNTGGGTGDFHVLIGSQAGEGITSGRLNIMLGFQAGRNTTSGSDNIMLGTLTGTANTSGSNNIYIGRGNGANINSSNNVAIGYNALVGASGSTASTSVAIGTDALKAVTSATNNLALGSLAATRVTSGSNNVSLGTSSFSNGTTGFSNIIIGSSAAVALTTGNNNIIIGEGAALGTTDVGGANSIIIGNSAARTVGTTEIDNLIAIGNLSATDNTFANVMLLGNNTMATAANQISIGASTHTTARFPNASLGIKIEPTQELDANGDGYIRDSLRIGNLPNQTSATKILSADASGWVGYRNYSDFASTWLKTELEASRDVDITGGSSTDFRIRNTRVQLDNTFKVGSDSSFIHNPNADTTFAKGVFATTYMRSNATATYSYNGWIRSQKSTYAANQGALIETNTQSSSGWLGGLYLSNLLGSGQNFQAAHEIYKNANAERYVVQHYTLDPKSSSTENYLSAAIDTSIVSPTSWLFIRIGSKLNTIPKSIWFSSAGSNSIDTAHFKFNNINGLGVATGKFFTVENASSPYFVIRGNGNIQFNTYGTPATTAAALSKTLSNYGVGFATDGTVTSREIKRDTTVYIDDADHDWSAAITTSQIASRYNRVIFWMTTTAAAGSDSELTLHTPDANLLQVEYLIHSVDEPAGFDNKIVFGTNNAVDSTNGLVTNYYPAAGDGIHIRAGLRSGVYKYRYSN